MNNAEANVLSAVLQDKQVHVLLQSNARQLFRTHADIYDYVLDYYEHNGQPPPAALVQQHFIDFEYNPNVGSTKHHVEELRTEFLDTSMRSALRSAASLLQEKGPRAAINEINARLGQVSRLTTAVKDVDVTDYEDAIAHFELMHSLIENNAYGIRTNIKGFDDYMPAGIAPGQFGIILAFPAIGKPLSMDTLVATPQGWRRNGDLALGDHVIARNGKPTEVIAVMDQGVLDAYRVTLSDGTSVITGPDHDWSVYTHDSFAKSKRLFVKTTVEMMHDLHYERKTEPNKKPIDKYILPLVEPVQYAHADLSVDPYTLGVLLGDGAISRETAYFICDDPEIADLIEKNNPDYLINRYKKYSSAGRKHSITPSFMSVLRKLGVAHKSDKKRVPQQYLFASVEQRLELLRGLMDTDGSCQPNSRPVFHSYNAGLANDVAELVRSLGGTARVDIYRNGTEYAVKMRLPFNPFNLARKAKNYVVKEWKRSVRKIEYVGKEEMRCITVADSESLYAANDYIMTHNSWLMLYLAVQAWLHGKVPLIVSLEMSEAEVRNRIFTILGSGLWTHRDLSAGNVDIESFRHWAQKTLEGKHKFHIISNEGIGDVTPAVLRGKIAQYKPDIVFVDYVQLMQSNEPSNNETVKIKSISRDLKLAAGADKIPIVIIASATPDDNVDMSEPPTMDQVAWSKQLMYDTDWIVALGRSPNSDVITVVARKNRNGPLFEFMLLTDFNRGLFKYKEI